MGTLQHPVIDFHRRRIHFLSAILLLAAACSGCQTLAGKLGAKEETGVVLARRTQIRSSVAVVAADLLEIERGDTVEILETDTAENGEKWLRVRARDPQKTEGWVEARNIMPQEMLERARKLAAEDEKTTPQATGQLRASTNLRITPDRGGTDNIMMKLDSGASFDIVGWKRVPRPKSSETTESDDAPKAGSAQNTNRRGKDKDAEEARPPEEPNELWYKVRLPRSISPAPAGWVYGKQVELTVPSDIIFYRTGREFVAWQRLDGETPTNSGPGSELTGGAEQTAAPGSWVILEKSGSNDPKKTEEVDFDRIFVLGYDKSNEEHYTAYRSPDLRGRLPLRLEGQGENKVIVVNLISDDATVREARYKLVRDNRGALKIEAPPDAGRPRKRS